MASIRRVASRAWNWAVTQKASTHTNIILAVTALVALFLQYQALTNSQRQFVRQLRIDHEQGANENALALWDAWDHVFDPEVRDDAGKLSKWLAGYPTEGSNMSTDLKREYSDWLDLFVYTTRLPSADYEKLRNNAPPHITSAFGLKEGVPLSVADADRIRKNVIRFLNLLEKVAIAWKYEVANKEILDYAFKPTVTRYTLHTRVSAFH